MTLKYTNPKCCPLSAIKRKLACANGSSAVSNPPTMGCYSGGNFATSTCFPGNGAAWLCDGGNAAGTATKSWDAHGNCGPGGEPIAGNCTLGNGALGINPTAKDGCGNGGVA